MGAMKTTTIVLVSIILIVILVSMVNVGMSLFMDRLNFDDYCDSSIYNPRIGDENKFDQESYDECNDRYRDAIDNYNQLRYYIFAGLGFILLLTGLFVPEITTKVVGLASGGILVTQGIVFNLQNKLIVFLTLLGLFVVFGVLAIRWIKKIK